MLEIKGSQNHQGKVGTKRSLWERMKPTAIILAVVVVIVAVGAGYAWYTSQHAGDVKDAKYINLGSSSKTLKPNSN